jgi:tetratricopeptide (TPR) repeat protein
MAEDFLEVPENVSMWGLAKRNSALIFLDGGGSAEEAWALLEDSIFDHRRALAVAPDNRDFQVRLGLSYEFLAQSLLRLGRHEEAVRAAREVVKLSSSRDDPALDLRNLAGYVAPHTEAVEDDETRPEAASALRAEAIELLSQAFDGGLRDRDEVRESDDFRRLREHQDFIAMFGRAEDRSGWR